MRQYFYNLHYCVVPTNPTPIDPRLLHQLPLTLLVLLTLLVSACRPTATQVAGREPLDMSAFYVEPTAAPRPVPPLPTQRTLEFWTDDNEPERISVYRRVAAQFTQRHPNLDVRVVPVYESSLAGRLATAHRAGVLPDLVRLGSEHLPTLAAADLLESDAADGVITRVGRADFRAGPLSHVTHPTTGQIMAVPYETWVQGLWYRRDLVSNLQLAPVATWDAIRQAACSPAAARRYEHGLVLPTEPGQNYAHQVFEQVAISNDAWPFDAAGRVTMNTPEMIAALAWYTDLQRCAVPGPQSAGTASRAFLRGRAAMLFYSTYIMDDLARTPTVPGRSAVTGPADSLAGHTGFAPVLAGPQGAAVYGVVVSLAILRDADPATRDLAAFFLQEGYADILALAPFGKVPVLNSAVESWKKTSADFNHYSEVSLAQVLAGTDNVQRWFSRPDYSLRERAVISAIEGRLLIPRVLHQIAVQRTLTPTAGAALLQREVEALLPTP